MKYCRSSGVGNLVPLEAKIGSFKYLRFSYLESDKGVAMVTGFGFAFYGFVSNCCLQLLKVQNRLIFVCFLEWRY